jgi:ATP-binding cassette subfamily C protein CydC
VDVAKSCYSIRGIWHTVKTEHVRVLNNKSKRTLVGAAALKISGGEARRLAIARTLLKDAPVMILDEPTEGLDPLTARRLMKNLLAHCQERTFVMITHQINELPDMDHILLLDAGELKGYGSHEQLLTDVAEYRALQILAPLFN